MTDELRDSLKGLYSAFRAYARLDPPVYSETNDPDGYSASLRSKPLHLLGPEDVRKFARKAMTTWGTEDDFRHYLPRIFELLTDKAGATWDDPEVAVGKLTYGRWWAWPRHEQTAVENFLRSLWRNSAADPHSPLQIDVCLCAIGQAVDDMSPYLNDWKIERSAGEAVQFSTLLKSIGERSAVSQAWKTHLGNAFWPDRGIQRKQVVDWLLADQRVTDLESAFFKFDGDPQTAEAISTGMSYLQNLRSAGR